MTTIINTGDLGEEEQTPKVPDEPLQYDKYKKVKLELARPFQHEPPSHGGLHKADTSG